MNTTADAKDYANAALEREAAAFGERADLFRYLAGFAETVMVHAAARAHACGDHARAEEEYNLLIHALRHLVHLQPSDAMIDRAFRFVAEVRRGAQMFDDAVPADAGAPFTFTPRS